MNQIAREVAGITIGTAGHIDHGKSSLVKLLTGTDPDRLPEEKERGITIDLGYATVSAGTDKSIGVIDVPGHEKFVRNMVAGATGMDLVILVVAADDGVMPQTREHLEIMGLLGISRGLVAITKTDLVDEEMLELVKEDVRDFIKGTFLENAPMVAVSNQSGVGLPELRSALEKVIASTPAHSADGPFRMPIQRVFSAKGHGTVVTGVPASGQVRTGESVEILPHGLNARVRRIQAYQSDVEIGKAGHRTALNLSDVSYKDLTRGDVVAAPGFFTPSTLVEGRLKYLKSAKHPLESGVSVRFHTGCMETIARCILLDCDNLEPGGEALCQLVLDSPAVVSAGDRFILRCESPMYTIGGGVLFGRSRFRLKRKRDFTLETLLAKETAIGNPRKFFEVLMRERGMHPLDKKNLPGEAEMERHQAEALALEMERSGILVPLAGGSMFVHASGVRLARERALSTMKSYFEANPLRQYAGRGVLVKETGIAEPLLGDALSRLLDEKLIEIRAGAYNLAGRAVKLSADMSALIERVEKAFKNHGLLTPTPEELAAELKLPAERVNFVFGFLLEKGAFVELRNGVIFHKDELARAESLIREFIQSNGKITAAEFRSAAATSRKYAIPILEHFDKVGLTIREGDNRKLLK
jgi:selenocysteine-specific elongation factor